MSVYGDLKVRRVVNAAAAQTKLGGSLMPEPVLAAMREAAGRFVDLPELHDRVGERLAVLTRNEAACISCGAAAGILVAVAACITGPDQERATALPDIDVFPRREVVYFRDQWNGFLSAARETGATLIPVGPTAEDLAAGIGERTAAVLWFAGVHYAAGAPSLAEIVATAHGRGAPVIVDAADQVPPASNLWHFTRDLGADLAIFSGGKGLRGPQSSGLVVGRADLIRACRANGGPFHSIARPAKVGKEEMVGLLAAVEWYLGRDEAAALAAYRRTAEAWVGGLDDLPGVAAELADESQNGEPIVCAMLRFEPSGPLRRDDVVAALWDRDPRVAVYPRGDDAIELSPHLLEAGEADLVLAAVREAVRSRRN